MKRDQVLNLLKNNAANVSRAETVLDIIYNKIYEEAMRGKGCLEMMWQYKEPVEGLVLHRLKEDGYDITYTSLEPRIVLISWI